MADTSVRIILKFNFGQQIRFAGWSESYDTAYQSLAQAVAASDRVAAFLIARVNCLGIGPILVECVLVLQVPPVAPGAPPTRRTTLSFPVPQAPKPGTAYNSAYNTVDVNFVADFANTVYYIALQTALENTPVYRRNCWIAGLPDVADQTDSPEILDPFVSAAVNTFLNALSNGNSQPGIQPNSAKNGISIRSVDRSGANPIKACTAWNLDVNTYTVPAHGFVAGQPIIAEGMKTTPGGRCPRGRYLVQTVIGPDTISLQGSQAPTPPLRTGGFRAAKIVFNLCEVATPQGFTKRDKGRPSGLAVGRRRTPLISRT